MEGCGVLEIGILINRLPPTVMTNIEHRILVILQNHFEPQQLFENDQIWCSRGKEFLIICHKLSLVNEAYHWARSSAIVDEIWWYPGCLVPTHYPLPTTHYPLPSQPTLFSVFRPNLPKSHNGRTNQHPQQDMMLISIKNGLFDHQCNEYNSRCIKFNMYSWMPMQIYISKLTFASYKLL